MTIIFEMAIKKHVKKFRFFFHFMKVLRKPSHKGFASLSKKKLQAVAKFSSD